ncbi:hypothetical protein O6H91_14G025100 [Diphasiastrum complanatum]|uniref:Uncharacterized protein n=1 Tax=Diphasiastrum complanatum TaxID=34168 RepID=A0ACC2BMF0_DIPCM|nr:hypothetical protein O6H91_14G025100 [Diphasiastrum complanatum]
MASLRVAGFGNTTLVLVVLLMLSIAALEDGMVFAAKPDCNQFQLLTCIGSAGGPPKDDCCQAIRRVLDPRCVCTRSTQANVQVLLPIAKSCRVQLDVSHCH